MSDKQVQFLPFNAINEFMLPDYRLHVIQMVFSESGQLTAGRRSAINNMVKRYVQVPGFRNSPLAPVGIKARSSVQVFERRPDFAALILQSWADLLPDLRQKVFEFLQAREWEVLPPDADRTKLPGFLPDWPEGQNYDVLGEAFTQMFPDFPHEENDLRLMIVWLAGRLPYDMYAEEEEEEEAE